ncbi:hypothetical protein [Streptomyces sp. ERV7]|uniref:hypothetical protein n=1 Tax=Streptomyces sp. ERV7 TaxID=1322334 RepID=UPI000AFF46AA|nr:hypothetical protein [Streptomyces sp. ERV7]
MGARRYVTWPLRHRRALAALGLVAGAAAGAAACDPVGGMSSVTVSVTTDKVATSKLEHDGVKVRYLTCTAKIDGGGGSTRTPSAGSTRTVATVDCRGRTDDNRKISVTGKVTEEREDRCVRGDLTAKVADRTVFHASVLGDCNAPPPTKSTPKPPGKPGSRPTVTVTVTVTESFRGK